MSDFRSEIFSSAAAAACQFYFSLNVNLKKAITVIGCWCCCCCRCHRFYLSAIAHRNRIGKFWWKNKTKQQRSTKSDENVFSLHRHHQRTENGKGHLKKLHTKHMYWRKQNEKESRDSRMNVSLRFTMRKSNFHFFLIGKCHDSVLPSIRYNLHRCKQEKLLCALSPFLPHTRTQS